MSEIKVGDLVVVRFPKFCCGSSVGLGAVFQVTDITSGPWRCMDCDARGEFGVDAYYHNDTWIDLRQLQRIPPLPELESEKREITA